MSKRDAWPENVYENIETRDVFVEGLPDDNSVDAILFCVLGRL